MSKIEKIIFSILFLVFISAFQHATKINYYVSQLDSAMMVENIDSTYTEHVPVSQINASALKAIATVIVQKAEEVCAQPLLEDRVDSINMFERHAYGILYVLALFRSFASGPAIASAFHTLSFVGLLFAVFLFLRREKLSIPVSLFFVAAVTVHPGWSAAAFGQFYPDRFFIIAGFVYMVLLHRRLAGQADHSWALVLTAIFASSLTERAAIMIGISTLATLILYRDWRSWNRKDLPLLGLGFAILSYAALYMKFVQLNSDYGSFSSQALAFVSNISVNETFRLNLVKYLWVNSPYLILSIFEWRLALIAFGSMVPNMIGSIGGAEKTGWSTHYHSMYFPFLIAAAGFGFVRLYFFVINSSIKYLLFITIFVWIIYAAMLSPYSLSPFWEFKKANIKNHAMMRVLEIEANFGDGASARIFSNYRKAIADVIPENVSVSAAEGMMPSLLGKGRSLYYYPLGIGNADYVILSYANSDNGELKYSGAISYLGAKNQDALDVCLNKRVENEYKLEKTVSPGAATSHGMAIFKRLKRE